MLQQQDLRHATALLTGDLQLALPGLTARPLPVSGFEGREALNELYELRVMVWLDPLDSPALGALVGASASLAIPHPYGARHIAGIVHDAIRLDAVDGRLVALLTLVPRLARLSHTMDARVFQRLTSEEIVRQVLDEHDVPCVFRLTRPLTRREYCVQYGETDLAFVQRLLAEDGLVLSFLHPESEDERRALKLSGPGECVLVFDSTLAYTPIDGPPAIPFRRSAGAVEHVEERIDELRLIARLASDQATVRAYDFMRADGRADQVVPTPPPHGVATQLGGVISASVGSDSADPYEVYDPFVPLARLGDPSQYAQVRLEQLRAGTEACAGSSDSRRLAPGRTLGISHHDAAPPTEVFVVVQVTHRAQDVSTSRPRYQNEFRGAPQGVLWRPPAPARRFVQTLETGLVVGIPQQEIDSQFLGMVRVQFAWDRLGRNNEHSSCWMRVAQPWGGAGHGVQFIPRLGAEVVVGFLGGDPDRPVVTGCLSHPANPPIHALPEHQTKSYIRTQTSPNDGGYNELAFEDKQGHELVSLRAQRNLALTVLQDRSATVSGNDSVEVAGESRARVGGSHELEVDGAHTLRVRGATSIHAEGTLLERVSGDRTAVTEGTSNTKASADVVVRAGKELRLLAGTDLPADAVLQSSAFTRISGAEKLQLISPKAIEIICGSSRITIGPDKISLQADQLELVGKKEVVARVKDTSVSIADKKLALASDELTLQGKAAAVKLDGELELKAPKIGLKSGSAAARSQPQDPNAQKGQAKFKLKCPPGMTDPLTVVLQTSTGELIEREAPPGGELTLDGLEGDHFEIVQIRVGDLVLQHSSAAGE